MAIPTGTRTFTAADATPLQTADTSFSINNGSFRINNNRLNCGTNDHSFARWNADTFNANQKVSATASVIGTSNYMGVAARVDTGGAQTGLVFRWGWSAGNAELITMTAGATTSHATIAAPSAGQVVTLEVSGDGSTNTISVKYDGVEKGPWTNKSIPASGQPGIYGYSNDTATLIDDWSADNVASSSYTPRRTLLGVG